MRKALLQRLFSSEGLLVAVIRLQALLVTALFVVSYAYWRLPDLAVPGAYAVLFLGVWPTALGTLIPLAFLLPDTNFRFLVALLWPDPKSVHARRFNILLGHPKWPRFKRYLLLFAVLAYSAAAFAKYVEHRGHQAVLCSPKIAEIVEEQAGGTCISLGPPHTSSAMVVCRVRSDTIAIGNVFVAPTATDLFGRVTLKRWNNALPLTPGLPVGFLSRVAATLLSTSDHPEAGAQNVDALRQMALQVQKANKLSDILELPPEQRYSAAVASYMEVLHYWLWAELSAIDRTSSEPPSRLEQFSALMRRRLGQSTEVTTRDCSRSRRTAGI